MDQGPLTKPDHLDAPASNEWLAKHAAGAIALALGILVMVVVLITQEQLWSTPDWRITVPGFALTGAAAIVSIKRREHASVLWLSGLGLAGAALVFGWFLMLAIVVGATALLILILHSVL